MKTKIQSLPSDILSLSQGWFITCNLPDVKNCRMTSKFSFYFFNFFWVLVILTRYFNVEYGIWKRIIAPFRLTSLLMTLKSARSLSFSVHFLHEHFFCTSVPFGMRQPKNTIMSYGIGYQWHHENIYFYPKWVFPLSLDETAPDMESSTIRLRLKGVTKDERHLLSRSTAQA